MSTYEERRQPQKDVPVPDELVPVEITGQLPHVLRTLARWLLVAVAMYFTGWLLWNGKTTLYPFIIGALLAFLLTPIVNYLSHPFPRWLAITTVYIGALVLFILFITYIAPLIAEQVQQAIDSVPTIAQMQTFMNGLFERYQNVVPASLREPLNASINSVAQTVRSNFTTYIMDGLILFLNQIAQIIQTLTFLAGFIVVPFWLFYVLNSEADGHAYVNRLLHPRLRSDFWNIWNIISSVLSHYLRGQLILAACVGMLVGTGMFALQFAGFPIPYPMLLAIIAGITEVIPYLGPMLGAIPGVIIGLFVSPTVGLLMIAVYVIVQQLENHLLVPNIIGREINIHPAILIIILFAAGGVFGLFGIFFAAPLAAIFRDMFVYLYLRLEGQAPEEAALALNTTAARS
jgi:predicted PurR-regulated permease PerM